MSYNVPRRTGLGATVAGMIPGEERERNRAPCIICTQLHTHTWTIGSCQDSRVPNFDCQILVQSRQVESPTEHDSRPTTGVGGTQSLTDSTCAGRSQFSWQFGAASPTSQTLSRRGMSSRDINHRWKGGACNRVFSFCSSTHARTHKAPAGSTALSRGRCGVCGRPMVSEVSASPPSCPCRPYLHTCKVQAHARVRVG